MIKGEEEFNSSPPDFNIFAGGEVMSYFSSILKGSLLDLGIGLYSKHFHKSAIDIYFQSQKESIKIPVNPSGITIPQRYVNKTAEIAALGEVNVLGNPALQEITIESFFPYGTNLPYSSFDQPKAKDKSKEKKKEKKKEKTQAKTPIEFVEFFKEAAGNKTPVRMIVTRLNISMLVSIESFERKNEAGDHDDIYYSLELKEYRPFGAIKLNFERNADGSIKTDDKGNWIVKEEISLAFSEDTLDNSIPAEVLNQEKGNIAAIAKRYTGDWGNWQSILDANKSRLLDGLGNYIGDKIKIPEGLRFVLKNINTKF